MCDHVCVCVVISFILDVRLLVDATAEVTQEEGHTGFLHLPSAMPALILIVRRIQPSLSLADREVEFCVYVRRFRGYQLYHRSDRTGSDNMTPNAALLK